MTPLRSALQAAAVTSTVPAEYAKHIQKVLFTQKQLQDRIAELGAEISKDYKGESILVVGLLKGAFLAVADVARSLSVPNMVDFMVASSYGDGTESTGVIKLKKDLDIDPSGRCPDSPRRLSPSTG